MNKIIRTSEVEESIISIRGQRVILDADIAELYGVETKEVNQAVKNNPAKFPKGYVFELARDEYEDLRSKNLTANISPKSRVMPKAFTEKGLYMLATIIKAKKRQLQLSLLLKHSRKFGNFQGLLESYRTQAMTSSRNL